MIERGSVGKSKRKRKDGKEAEVKKTGREKYNLI